MMYALQFLRKFKKEEKGQALTEYGLIIGLIAVALVLGLGALSGVLGDMFQAITTALTPPAA